MLTYIFIIVFLFLINIVNKKVEIYTGIPIYTKLIDIINHAREYLFKDIIIQPIIHTAINKTKSCLNL